VLWRCYLCVGFASAFFSRLVARSRSSSLRKCLSMDLSDWVRPLPAEHLVFGFYRRTNSLIPTHTRSRWNYIRREQYDAFMPLAKETSSGRLVSLFASSSVD